MSRALRVVVDRDLCEAQAECVRFAPEVFAIDEHEVMQVLIERPGEELRAKVQQAIGRCPRLALSLEDE